MASTRFALVAAIAAIGIGPSELSVGGTASQRFGDQAVQSNESVGDVREELVDRAAVIDLAASQPLEWNTIRSLRLKGRVVERHA